MLSTDAVAPVEMVPGIEDPIGVRLSRPKGEKSKLYLELIVPFTFAVLRHS